MKIASSLGEAFPVWYDGRHINESCFCQHYLSEHQLCYTEGAFFTPEGCMADETPLKVAIFQQVEPYAALSVARKITGILELLKIMAHVEELPPQDDRIHLQNFGQRQRESMYRRAQFRVRRSRNRWNGAFLSQPGINEKTYTAESYNRCRTSDLLKFHKDLLLINHSIKY